MRAASEPQDQQLCPRLARGHCCVRTDAGEPCRCALLTGPERFTASATRAATPARVPAGPLPQGIRGTANRPRCDGAAASRFPLWRTSPKS